MTAAKRTRRKAPEPEPIDAGPEALSLLNGLASAAPPKAYQGWDKIRDFRAVFLGSDQGLRVLYQIMEHLEIMRSPVRKLDTGVDPYSTMHAIGREDVGRWLLGVLTVEPRPQPSKTVSDPNEE